MKKIGFGLVIFTLCVLGFIVENINISVEKSGIQAKIEILQNIE